VFGKRRKKRAVERGRRPLLFIFGAKHTYSCETYQAHFSWLGPRESAQPTMAQLLPLSSDDCPTPDPGSPITSASLASFLQAPARQDSCELRKRVIRGGPDLARDTRYHVHYIQRHRWTWRLRAICLILMHSAVETLSRSELQKTRWLGLLNYPLGSDAVSVSSLINPSPLLQPPLGRRVGHR
jgi:hypothetical protein